MNNFYSMFSGNTGDKECEAYIEECRNAVEELGKKAETDANYLVYVIFLILIISVEYAYEKRCHMIAFLNTSKERSRVKAVKLLKILMISFLIWGLSVFIDIFNI